MSAQPTGFIDPDREPRGNRDSSRAGDDERQDDINDMIDVDAALRRVPGGMESVRELAELMITECARIVADIHQAIDDGDTETLRRGAHTLRGSADVFSAKPVVDVARRLEDFGRSAKLGRAAALLVELDRETERLDRALRALIDPLTPDE